MSTDVTYQHDYGAGTVELTLSPGRLVTRTHGRGLLDRPKLLDLALTDLVGYAVLPGLAANQSAGHDSDSFLVFTYRVAGKSATKRLFVNNDHELRLFLTELARQCPEASMLHLPEGEAYRRLGVVSPNRGLYILFGLFAMVVILAVSAGLVFG